MGSRHTGRSKHILALAIVAALAAGLLWGIGSALGASTSPSPAASAVVLHVGTVQDADNLNPFIGYSGTAYEIFHLNYDLLVGYTPSNFAPRPELATSWSHSADGLTWTFNIRHGVSWQDGVPLTASDVAFTYNYIIKNNLFAFTSYTTNIKTVVATDPYTAKFILDKPKADMLRSWVPILPQHVWGKISGNVAGNSYINKPPIVGSGPFQVTEVKKGQYIKLTANKSYWGGAPKVDEVIFQIYQNPETMVSDLKTGVIQAAEHIPPAQFGTLSSVPGVTPIASNVAAEKYFDELAFNCYDSPDSMGNPVLLDPKFRQALAWAVDKQKLVQIAYGGRAVPGSSIVVPGLEYAWQPAAEPGLRLRLEQGRPDAHSGRLPAEERRAPEQAGQAHRPAAHGAPAGGREPGRRQADHELVQQARPEDQVLGGRRGRAVDGHLQHEGQGLRARLGHVPLGVG